MNSYKTSPQGARVNYKTQRELDIEKSHKPDAVKEQDNIYRKR